MWWNSSTRRKAIVKAIPAGSGCMRFPTTALSRANKTAPLCICCRRGVKGQESVGAAEAGVGGGVMLQVLGIVYPILVGVILLQMALAFFTTSTVPSELWCSLAIQICTWLFLNSGMLFCMARLSAAVRGRKPLGQPIHASDDTLFSVHLYRKYIYDFILSLSRSLPFRAFETGQMV